ncbi:hypothetical protein KKA00_07515 [bacterium]|nr:hypothetical protein [bacterium]MBU1652053.1 hypothetical protein [bacterium]
MTSSTKSLTDHILLWFRNRWLIVRVVFITAVLSVIVSLIIPKTYRSTAIVLPPAEAGSQFPFGAGLMLDVFGANEVSTAALVPLLKSRNLLDRVDARLDLVGHYEKDDMEKTAKAFEEHLEIELETEESFAMATIVAIALSALDKDPQFAADLVNVVVEEWNDLYVQINREGARLRKHYLEENLNETRVTLAQAEDSLRKFQEKYGIAAIEAQVEGTVMSVMQLNEKIINAKVTADVLSKIFQPSHPELKRARLELQELLKQQQDLKQPNDDVALMLPLELAPELGLVYTRLFRDVKTLEAIYAVLVQQYEQAKMQAMKDTPSFRVVDHGKVPIKKYKPKRAVIVVMAAISALFFAMIYVYIIDYIQLVKGTDDYRWIEEIETKLKADAQKLGFKQKKR